MDVLVIEKSTGTVVAKYKITLAGLNYTPSEKECFDEAWKCACDDKIASPDSRDKYSFAFA